MFLVLELYNLWLSGTVWCIRVDEAENEGFQHFLLCRTIVCQITLWTKKNKCNKTDTNESEWLAQNMRTTTENDFKEEKERKKQENPLKENEDNLWQLWLLCILFLCFFYLLLLCVYVAWGIWIYIIFIFVVALNWELQKYGQPTTQRKHYPYYVNGKRIECKRQLWWIRRDREEMKIKEMCRF